MRLLYKTLKLSLWLITGATKSTPLTALQAFTNNLHSNLTNKQKIIFLYGKQRIFLYFFLGILPNHQFTNIYLSTNYSSTTRNLQIHKVFIKKVNELKHNYNIPCCLEKMEKLPLPSNLAEQPHMYFSTELQELDACQMNVISNRQQQKQLTSDVQRSTYLY